MTTTRPVDLDLVGEALVDAHQVLASTSDEKVIENALVALCRASYDVLVSWEVSAAHDGPETLAPESWRTPLDELRLQAALAEMELRTSGAQGRRAADRLTHAVSHQLTAARRDVGEAVDSLRNELRRVLA